MRERKGPCVCDSMLDRAVVFDMMHDEALAAADVSHPNIFWCGPRRSGRPVDLHCHKTAIHYKKLQETVAHYT